MPACVIHGTAIPLNDGSGSTLLSAAQAHSAANQYCFPVPTARWCQPAHQCKHHQIGTPLRVQHLQPESDAAALSIQAAAPASAPKPVKHPQFLCHGK